MRYSVAVLKGPLRRMVAGISPGRNSCIWEALTLARALDRVGDHNQTHHEARSL